MVGFGEGEVNDVVEGRVACIRKKCCAGRTTTTKGTLKASGQSKGDLDGVVNVGPPTSFPLPTVTPAALAASVLAQPMTAR